MAQRAPPYVVFAHRPHRHRGHHPNTGSQAFKRILKRQGIDDRGQHPHVICGNAIHAGPGQPLTAKNIAAAYDDRGLHSQVGKFLNLARDACNHRHVDAVRLPAHEGLATQLQQNTA